MFKSLFKWFLQLHEKLSSKPTPPARKITDRQCLALIVVIPWISLLISPSLNYEVAAVYPPRATKIIQFLQNEISLAPGDQFKGRLATFTGLTDATSRKTWIDLHGLDQQLIQALGNDHRMVGLWFYNIPTLFEYSPLISPAFHAYGKRFLALPQDGQIRNVITMRNIQIKYLQSIGVRFIVTDIPRNELSLRVQIPVPNFGFLYLYELPFPNLGQYSPYEVEVSKSVNETLDMLGRDDFDFTKQFVASDNIDTKLVPASDVSFFYGNGFIHIKASSTGTSLLALPLEYSHCIDINQIDSSMGKGKMLRVNLLQSGLLFEKSIDAKLRYFTGPYSNSSCRLADSIEFRRLISQP